MDESRDTPDPSRAKYEAPELRTLGSLSERTRAAFPTGNKETHPEHPGSKVT